MLSLRSSNADTTKATKHQSTEKRNSSVPACPPCKQVKGTRFQVDAFLPHERDINCNGYFLSHFHSDHYRGITSKFRAAPIYCSQVTANLLRHRLGVDPAFIRPIPLHVRTRILNVWVTLLDANHCPGSCMFYFEVPTTGGSEYEFILHSGDCRYHPSFAQYPQLTQVDGT